MIEPQDSNKTTSTDRLSKSTDRLILRCNCPECIKEFILKLTAFKEISEQILDLVVKSINLKEYKRGDYIIRRGDRGYTMYIIGKGEVIVPIVDKFEDIQTFEDIVYLYSGNIFGEMALLNNDVRSADVIVESKEITLLEIHKNEVDLILDHSPQFGEFLTELLRQRLKGSNNYIGKYKVMGLLGKGATSDVYRINNESIDKSLAIKVLNHSMINQGAQLIKEARLLARLTHRNIIQVFDLEQAYGTIGIIMEELNGKTLDTIIIERKKSGQGFIFNEILSIIRQLADGISYVNKLGIIHKDIKPANCIYIEESDTIKLMDFGIAKRINTSDIETATELKGTPLYIAPETILGKEIDYRADIYSLGVIAYELSCGRKLFDSNDLLSILKMHINTEPDYSFLPEDLPNGITEFIKGALQKDPNMRLCDWDHIKYLLDTDLMKLQGERFDDIEKEKTNSGIRVEKLEAIKQSVSRFGKDADVLMKVMLTLIEMNDPKLTLHQQRVAILANDIGERLGLSSHELKVLNMSGLIHDVGKVVIPTSILYKQSKLMDSEYDLIKNHPTIGFDLLKTIDFDASLAQIVYQHHERINGTGYPNGLFSKDILPLSKIICVADVLEAMSSDRPFRNAQFMDTAIEEISINKGILFDSDVVDTCLEIFSENINKDIFSLSP